MKEWLRISCLLCVFGFFRELRPSEPYITEFLLGEWRNVTQDEVNRDVYPIGTYSYLVQLIIVFLITDYLRYKPLLIAIGVTGTIIWSMLIWTTSLLALQILEVFYGTYMAAEVAYYTYIYAKVDKKYYPRVTSHTRAAMFVGKLVAGASSQLLINYNLMNYKELNYISLAAQIIALFWAIGLPKVDTSLYFHREAESPQEFVSTNVVLENTLSVSSKDHTSMPKMSPFQLIWYQTRSAYTNMKVVQWSIWYSVAMCGYLQVGSYIQVLWKDIEPNPSTAWNGAVDAIFTTIAAVSAFSAGYIHAGRLDHLTSLLTMAVLSASQGVVILLCCLSDNIYLSYMGFILFGCFYSFTITVASAEVARYLEEESFGLVFGINTFLALVMQSLLTLVVVSRSGFSMTAHGQYSVYAFLFIFIAIVYFIAIVAEMCIKNKSQLLQR